MKPIKYLMGALLLGCSTGAMAQDGTKADIDAVKNLIKSNPADMAKAMKPFYKENKKNPENLVAFGRAFYEAKDTTNAKVAANNALTASKRQYAPAYVLLGDIAAMGDDGGAAAAMYEQAIYYDKTNPDPYRKYALVYRKIDPDGAAAKLDQLQAERPDYPVDALKAHIYYLSLQYGKAIETYAKVPTSKMTRSDFIEYANASFVAQQYQQGYDAAVAGLAKEPNNGTLTRLAMFCCNKLKKYDEAVKYGENLFTKVPKDSINYSHLDYLNYGNALEGTEQIDKAIEQYKKGLALEVEEQDLAELHKSLSDAHKQKKNFPDAIASYKKYLDTAKDPDAIAFAGLGLLNQQHARSLKVEGQETLSEAEIAAYKEADKVWSDLAEKYPDAAEYALFQRANVNMSLDPKQEQGLAKPYFEKLVELINAHTERDATDETRLVASYGNLMQYYYNVEKNKEKALEYAKKLVEIKPDNEQFQKMVESLSKAVK